VRAVAGAVARPVLRHGRAADWLWAPDRRGRRGRLAAEGVSAAAARPV
jgi:hypothetical protein